MPDPLARGSCTYPRSALSARLDKERYNRDSRMCAFIIFVVNTILL